MRDMGLLWLLVVGCSGTSAKDTDTDAADADTDTDSDTDADTDADTDTDTTITVPDPTGDPATVELSGECALAERYGGFSVDLNETYSLASGTVADGVVPVTILEEVGVDGACRLLKRNNPFCDPPCAADQTCDFDGSCVPFPLNQDIGVVTIGGLAEDVVMHPVQPGNNYFDAQMPHPAFGPGDLIELRTVGNTWGEDIVLHGVGVEPLALNEQNWVIRSGEDLQITWNSAGASLRSTIQVRLNIDQHGITPVTMYCDLPDTGSAALPAVLVDELIGFGVTGFPNATVTRRTVDSVTMNGGCVQLAVNSPATPDVLVDGYIPCNTDQDCIKVGLTSCNDVTFICE